MPFFWTRRVNAKMGGVNWTVRNPALDDVVRSGPTMIIGASLAYPSCLSVCLRVLIIVVVLVWSGTQGADVSHPPPRVMRPSIASVVGSYDMPLCQYTYGIRIQNPRQEIIGELKDMVIVRRFLYSTSKVWLDSKSN